MFNIKILETIAKKYLFKAIILAVPLLISGCMSSYSNYNEKFSETYVSTDFKKALVIGADQYSYVFDLPDSLSAIIKSPLRSVVRFQFPDGGVMAFNVKKDGSITGQFYVTLPDSYFQDHGDMKPLAERLGFVHGRLSYSYKLDRTDVIEDSKSEPISAGLPASEMSEHPKATNGVYFISLTIEGRRFPSKDVPVMRDAYHYTMNEHHKVLVVDNQHGSVDLFGPVVIATGASACIAILPVCLAAALPMAGLKP